MADDKDLFEKIASNFAELSARERQVLKDRFGIDLIRMPSIEEVARAFARTREKLRDFERRATEAAGRKPPGGDGPGTPPAAETPGGA
jgi:DNA-directed RNA polymerase sigma subunit (sigma70/sigma32)